MAAVPAHYWEDALRHSVYLTLVRDKIDQLIAQDVSHETKPFEDVNDHDLWDKIKNAPFDRIETEEQANIGDVTIMSKGRLMEVTGGYRFKEDKKTKEKCNDDNCMDGVKALWSVKRIRQRDVETSPGRYHYELTFSVLTQAPKRQRKPFENPARTFTVRETSPEIILDQPHEYKSIGNIPAQRIRPGRALWVHKNIVSPQKYQARHHQHHSTDRLFTSLFMDDDYDGQRRPPVPYSPPVYSQYSKVGYVGSPSDHHHYKKYTPYYKHHSSVKYSKPQMPPPQHHYLDIDAIGVVSAPYVPQPPDTRYQVPMKVIKTTRPPVLPTPVHVTSPSKNITFLPTVLPSGTKNENISTYTTKPMEPNVSYKPKPTPVKISYFTDNVRPPVYNAPPGVFVTMDKKPFKPLPPLKLHSVAKLIKPSKPLDFRPSPQLLDIQFSEPDPLFDGAFRPMAVNYSTNKTNNETESKIAESSHTKEHFIENDNTTELIIPKKPKKSQRVTSTSTTMANTLETTESDYDISWGNLLGAFVKTTPMDSHEVKLNKSDGKTSVSTSTTTSTTESPTTMEEIIEKEPSTTTVTSTTQKRTRPPRPPPKFKTNKIRKHKRVTTTTPQTSTSTSISEKVRKISNDLTPQASSAATSGTKAITRWSPSSTTTTTTQPTTTITLTTIESRLTTNQEPPQDKPRNKNRYRQSTLMQKGTSVKHDKWSVTNSNVDKMSLKTVIPPTGQFRSRGVESKFVGYIKSSTQPTYFDENEEDDYDDYNLNTTTEQQKIKYHVETTTIETSDNDNQENTDHTQENEHNKFNEVQSQVFLHKDKGENSSQDGEEETKLKSTLSIYPTTLLNTKSSEVSDTKTVNDYSENVTIKTKKKCKRKNVNVTESPLPSNTELELSSTTVASTTPDIFEELFGSFTSEESNDSNITKKFSNDNESTNDDFIESDDEFLDFLNMPKYKTTDKKNIDDDDVEDKNDDKIEDEDYEDNSDDYNNEFDDDDHESGIGNTSSETKESRNIEMKDHSHPYSIFELMAMD